MSRRADCVGIIAILGRYILRRMAKQGSDRSALGPRTWFIFQQTAWWLIIILSLVTGIVVLRVLLTHGWGNVAHAEPALLHFLPAAKSWLLLLHICTAVPCLALGPWLFHAGLRQRYPPLHRRLGQIYVAGVLVSAVVGFALASVNAAGYVARLGFMTLACVWFYYTWRAYGAAVARHFVQHRRWMIRSYAISLAVVTVRFLPPPEGLTREAWYPIMTWACWVPNALLAEWYVRATDHLGRYRRAGRKC